jgi:hypothetical protein
MEKFDKIIEQILNMNDEEKLKMLEDKKRICICSGCPTYNDCAQKTNELIFCILGKSSGCITEEMGCICPSCPIVDEIELKNEFFCTRGSEKEQRIM